MIEIVDQFIMSRVIWITQIWCIVILFHSLTIYLFCKTPGASEIVFRTSSADCRIFVISVNIEFYFAFSPPVTFQCCQSNISSYIMSFSFYTIEDCVIFLFLCQALPFPLCMEISDIFRKFIIQTIIYLIEKCRNFICMLIFQSGLSTDGYSSSSQYIRITRSLNTKQSASVVLLSTVIQI